MMNPKVRTPNEASRRWGKGYFFEEKPLRCQENKVATVTIITVKTSVFKRRSKEKGKPLPLSDLDRTTITGRKNLIHD